MKHTGIFLKTTFEEMETLSRGTEFEGKRMHLFLDETTAAPIISIFMTLYLRFKFNWNKIYIIFLNNKLT